MSDDDARAVRWAAGAVVVGLVLGAALLVMEWMTHAG